MQARALLHRYPSLAQGGGKCVAPKSSSFPPLILLVFKNENVAYTAKDGNENLDQETDKDSKGDVYWNGTGRNEINRVFWSHGNGTNGKFVTGQENGLIGHKCNMVPPLTSHTTRTNSALHNGILKLLELGHFKSFPRRQFSTLTKLVGQGRERCSVAFQSHRSFNRITEQLLERLRASDLEAEEGGHSPYVNIENP